MEARLLPIVVVAALYVINTAFYGSVQGQSLDHNCLHSLLATDLPPCRVFGRQRLAPCSIQEDRDLSTLLKSDAFRVMEVGGEYVPRSIRLSQVPVNSLVFPTDSTLYSLQPTLSVKPTAVCVTGVSSPHSPDVCRVLYTEGRSFNDAKLKCEDEGGLVLSISNAWDQDNLPAISSEVWIGLEYYKRRWVWHGPPEYWGDNDYTNAAITPNITIGHESAYMRRDGAWAFTSQSDAFKPFICERAKPTVGCGTGYATHGEKCYKYVLVAMTHHAAMQYCEAELAYLVHINSDAEQTAVYQVGLKHEIWIGLHLKDIWKWQKKGTFKWHDGKPDHAPWVTGKPVLGDKCASLLPDGTWDSTSDCSQLKGVICDIPRVSALQWNDWTATSVGPWDAESTASITIEGKRTQDCPIKRFAFNTGKRSDCLQTYRGFLYLGSENKTFDGDQCQRWDTIDESSGPLPKHMNTKTSLSALENHCATSTLSPTGPLCETEDPDQGPKPCKIPTCPFVRETTCKTTLTGKEYEGTLNTAFNGAACLPWNTIAAVADLAPFFPEKNLTLAENYCRNPTNDGYGPYCYTDSTTRVECAIPICEWISQTTCRATRVGWDYIGQIATTVSGTACLYWDSRYPTNVYPEKTIYPANFCRNPDEPQGPWCYLIGGSGWEYCVVPVCDHVKQTDCKTSLDGWEYQGTLNVDHMGRDCNLWNATALVDSFFIDGTSSDAVNYCRSPGTSHIGPFCIVDNNGSDQPSLCDIPICDKVRRTTCRTSPTGWEYVGTMATTASGKTCQRWDSQTPNSHTYADDKPTYMVQDNFCRNPDNNEYGPWCYKADEAGYEHCDIPLCEDEY